MCAKQKTKMNFLYSLILSIGFFNSCSSQNDSIAQKVQKTVNEYQKLLNLSQEQSEQFKTIEKAYLIEVSRLKKSDLAKEKLKISKDNRMKKLKKILSKEQLLKLDVIENNRIKQVPIRSI